MTPESPWRPRHRCCCQSALVCTSYLGGRDIQRQKKEKRTAFFISLTAHYHGNSPGLAWLAGPPLPITGGNNTIRRERGGEMRVQYCIQSIILQLTVFSCRLGRSVLGGSNNSLMSDLTEKYESVALHRSYHGSVLFLIAGGVCVLWILCFFFKCSIVQLLRWGERAAFLEMNV